MRLITDKTDFSISGTLINETVGWRIEACGLEIEDMSRY